MPAEAQVVRTHSLHSGGIGNTIESGLHCKEERIAPDVSQSEPTDKVVTPPELIPVEQ